MVYTSPVCPVAVTITFQPGVANDLDFCRFVVTSLGSPHPPSAAWCQQPESLHYEPPRCRDLHGIQHGALITGVGTHAQLCAGFCHQRSGAVLLRHNSLRPPHPPCNLNRMQRVRGRPRSKQAVDLATVNPAQLPLMLGIVRSRARDVPHQAPVPSKLAHDLKFSSGFRSGRHML